MMRIIPVGWSGVMLLAAVQISLVVLMINNITITNVSSEDEVEYLLTTVEASPESASWWLYLVGAFVVLLGVLVLFWRPFKIFQLNVVAKFFLGVVPMFFSVVIVFYVLGGAS